MFRSEWKKLKSPMMIIVILALILVPFLYNSIFLSAFWDPYGKTENIKVAVVNEDKATKFEGEKIDIGDQFVKKLKKNDDFDWQYLSRKDAAKKLRAGDIYMTVVIPKKFSHNATTLLDDHPKKIELEYYLNPAKNYSGTQISSAAAKQLNEKIRKSVTKQYSSAIFGSLKKIAKGLEDASEGSAKLEDGAKKTTDGAKTLTTNLGKLTSGTNDLSTNLTKATDGSAQISTGLNTLSEGAQTLAEKSGQLSGGLNELDANSGKLIKGSTDLQAGSTKLRQGLETASAGTTELRQGLETASAGASKLDNNLPQFTAGLDQLNARAQEANASLVAVNDAADTLKQDLSTRREALEANVANIKAVIASSETLTEEEKAALLASIATMEQNVQNLAQQETALDASLAKANDATAKINQLAVAGQDIASAVSKLNGGLGQLLAGSKRLEQGQTQLLAGAKTLEQGQNTLNQGLTTYTDGVHKAAAGSTQLTAGAQKIATGANDLSTASGDLTSGLGQLSDGAVALSSGAGQLTDGASRLADGNSKLADGANTLKTELGKGAKDATIKPSNARDNMLAEPVVLKEHDYSTVNNYGSGLAAYILSIALFAGALMFSSVYQIRPEHGETLTWRFLVGKLSIILPIGALQGIAASVAIVYVLDADVASTPALYGFAALTGMTFITLLFTLTMLFGRVGQFSAFLLLLLQIGGSGGTFPVEMTPSFFQTIHRFLPMTYSVTGFREALGIGVTDTLITNGQILGLILFSALAISFAGALGGKRILLSTKARKRHDTV
ncbi:YhgE/Pip domain-containing protein [Exiguobacterium sp. Helios]|uniref:YhgE/Pip domain-containing protein n=1 Tax=unclassified Exiguobacterium TaxID=2644629 RepID=UPI00104973DC|nr:MULTISPECIES: YhgE/Pip domain-containing protein [unclassified Exiguobacterium]QNR20168.1 YhgE/Pip domain-containing protein [Exiguobacterium sp. Helios]